jgi:hypothetical protein
MSGLETLLASAFTSLTTTGTAAATTTAATTAGATTAGAITASSIPAIAGGTAQALSGAGITSGFAAPAAGLGTVVTGAATLAGAASQLLTSAPKIEVPQAPTRDDSQLEAERRAKLLRRRGRAATLLTSPSGVQSSPTLGAPSLTGYG